MGKTTSSASNAENIRREKVSFEDYLQTVRAEFDILRNRFTKQVKEDMSKMLVELKQDLQNEVDKIRIPMCYIPGCHRTVKKRISFLTEHGKESMNEMLVCVEHCKELAQQSMDNKLDWKEADYGG